MFNTNKGMKALPVPKKGNLKKKLKKTPNAHQYNSTFGYAQDTDNKYREAKGAIWEKCFLSREQYLFASVLRHTTIYHS